MAEVVPYKLQIECIERELKLRRRVYPRRVEGGQMTQELADREVARMEAVKRTLELVEALYGDLVAAADRDAEPEVFVEDMPGTADSIVGLLEKIHREGRPAGGEQKELF